MSDFTTWLRAKAISGFFSMAAAKLVTCAAKTAGVTPSVMRLAIGLTVWFSATTTLMLILMQSRVELPEFFVLLPVIITMTYYLLPVRWALILALFIKSVRAHPFERLPRAHGIQVGFVVLVQLVLGLMSVIGLVLLWTETSKIGDRVAGFVFHACIPLVMLLFLARRSKRMNPVVPVPPVPTP